MGISWDFMRSSWDFRGERNGNSDLPSSKHGHGESPLEVAPGTDLALPLWVRRTSDGITTSQFLERAPNPRCWCIRVCITSVWVIQQELSWQPLPPRPSAACGHGPGHYRQGYRVTPGEGGSLTTSPTAKSTGLLCASSQLVNEQSKQSKAPRWHFRLRSDAWRVRSKAMG